MWENDPGHPTQPLGQRCRHWSRGDTAGELLTIKVSCELPCDQCVCLAWPSARPRNILPVLMFERQSVLSRALGKELLWDVPCCGTCPVLPASFRGWVKYVQGHRNKAGGGGEGPGSICWLCNKTIAHFCYCKLDKEEGRVWRESECLEKGMSFVSEASGIRAESVGCVQCGSVHPLQNPRFLKII